MISARVLVFGDDVRSFLSVVRSLGRRGIELDVCAQRYNSPALHSRYIKSIHRLPVYEIDRNRWIEAVRQLLQEKKYDLVIPCDDRSIICLMENLRYLGECRMALPSLDSYKWFFDKIATRELSEICGVPIASGSVLQSSDTAESLEQRFGFPLAIKPRRSIVPQNIHVRQTVQIVSDKAGLQNLLEGISDPGSYLVESFFRGEGVGVSVLACRGELLNSFQHRRVSEAGPTSGSSYRVSEPVDPALLRDVEKLAKAAKLHGVAMFEFRQNRETSEYVLLEVNARFWGSLPLAVGAGVDFPLLLFELLVHDRKTKKTAYRIGYYSRNFSSDFQLALSSVADRSKPVSARMHAALSYVMVCVLRLASGREQWDSFSWNDLGPWCREFSDLVSTISGAIRRRVKFLRTLTGILARRRMAMVLKRASSHPPKILFLCSGNICRSPFAAELLRLKLESLAVHTDIASAGLLPTPGRSCPEDAISIARDFGVGLETHRSNFAEDELICASDIIFLFDVSNQNGLESRGLDRGRQTFFVNDIINGSTEIADPFGKGRAAFNRAYADISKAVSSLAHVFKSRGGVL